jgi:hypothetical protein
MQSDGRRTCQMCRPDSYDSRVDSFWKGRGPHSPIPYSPWGRNYHFGKRYIAEAGMFEAARRGDAEGFGQFLHMYQDTYSHAGLNPWSHFRQRFAPDQYNENCERDKQMREGTIKWLGIFKIFNPPSVMPTLQSID